MSTYKQLKDLILAQGIVTEAFIYPNAHLIEDLAYNAGDIAELARMAERTFHIQIGPADYAVFTNLRAVVHLLNNKQIQLNLTTIGPDHSSLD